MGDIVGPDGSKDIDGLGETVGPDGAEEVVGPGDTVRSDAPGEGRIVKDGSLGTTFKKRCNRFDE